MLEKQNARVGTDATGATETNDASEVNERVPSFNNGHLILTNELWNFENE